MKDENHELVGKILTSDRRISLMKHITDLDGHVVGKRAKNMIWVGDHLFVFEVEEYDCYCKNKNNGLYACLSIAWTPRIAIRFITPKSEFAGLDMPFALTNLAFHKLCSAAPETADRSSLHWSDEHPQRSTFSSPYTRWHDSDWSPHVENGIKHD